jgi:hypothetical protein
VSTAIVLAGSDTAIREGGNQIDAAMIFARVDFVFVIRVLSFVLV